MRVRLDVAYDGSAFAGWATQPTLPTVQGSIEAALEVLARQPLTLTVAGRTDAGVHARGQVAHVDFPDDAWNALPGPSGLDPADSLVRRLNGLLKRSRGPQPDIVIMRASPAPEGFDARFSALARHYCYRIADAGIPHNPLRRHDVLFTDRKLNVEAMNKAAQLLVGEHDFLAFCKPREGATTIRTVLSVAVRRSDFIEITISADAFCHSMVRAIVGDLVAVGEGRVSPDHVATRLAARKHDGMMVTPAHGLTLEKVDYPPASELAARARLTRRRRDEPVIGG